MENKKKRDWSKTKYKKLARLSEENHLWLDQHKGKRTIAGMIDAIIDFYKKNGQA